MGSSRPIGRKVTIVYENCNPKDSAELLRAVANELRPREVEIQVKSSQTEPDATSFADEQLETLARERTNRVLKKANRTRQVISDPKVIRRKLVSRINSLVKQGWQFTAKVVPVAHQVVKFVKDVRDMFN